MTSTNRQDDLVFRYVRDILATQDPDTRSPVVFGLGRVGNAPKDFERYLGYVLMGGEKPRTGELRRAVRQIFVKIANQTIGDGSVPTLSDTTPLPSHQVAELSYYIISLVEKTTSDDWRKHIYSWTVLFVTYNTLHGDLWQGFVNTQCAKNGNPVLIYRMFLLASGITQNTKFDPSHSRLENASLPRSNEYDYQKFKAAVGNAPDILNSDIRSKIWSGFMNEQNPHYLAANFPKPPSQLPGSPEAMLEMFDSYFNGQQYRQDILACLSEFIETLKFAKQTITAHVLNVRRFFKHRPAPKEILKIVKRIIFAMVCGFYRAVKYVFRITVANIHKIFYVIIQHIVLLLIVCINLWLDPTDSGEVCGCLILNIGFLLLDIAVCKKISEEDCYRSYGTWVALNRAKIVIGGVWIYGFVWIYGRFWEFWDFPYAAMMKFFPLSLLLLCLILDFLRGKMSLR